MYDLHTAIKKTRIESAERENGFRDVGVPAILYTMMQEAKLNLDVLTNMKSSSQFRTRIIESLISDLDKLIQSGGLLISGIKTAQSKGGWDTESNDLMERSWSILQMEFQLYVNGADVLEISKSSSFYKWINADVEVKIGIKSDITALNLGIYNWFRTPVLLAIVPKESLGYGLGLRSEDVLVSVEDRTIHSLLDLKSLLIAHVGSNVNVVVERGGDQITINMDLPEILLKVKE